MHLTARFKLRANDHDRRRLRIALSRWSAVFSEATERASARQTELLRAIILWRSSDGKRQRLVVEKRHLRAVLRECVRGLETQLHASARASLEVVLERSVGAWLGQYVAWLEGGRNTPKPRFPSVPTCTPGQARAQYDLTLDLSPEIITLQEEQAWRADLCRRPRRRGSPLYFGAATSGGEPGLNHCGLLRREDGRYFALLTLWAKGDPLGEPVRRAGNRQDAGGIRNVRAEREFSPAHWTRSSMVVPLEMARGQEQLFFGRAQPQSAQLVSRGDEYFLHVNFDFPDHLGAPLSGNILAVGRGVTHLLTGVVMDPEGNLLHQERFSGEELTHRLTELRRERKSAQQRGRELPGERRISAITEHHLYRAGHRLIDLARRFGAEIVLLAASRTTKPDRHGAYRHQHRLAEILCQLAAEAGLPAPQERKIYGSWRTCVSCGWTPGEPVRDASVGSEQCPACGTARERDHHLLHLLALDTLRLRHLPDGRPALGEFIRRIRAQPPTK